jgi:hypothetical protein
LANTTTTSTDALIARRTSRARPRFGVRGFLRRRHFVVRRGLQMRLLGGSIVELLVFGLLIGGTLMTPLLVAMISPDLSSPKTYESAQRLLFLNSRFWPALGLALTIVVLHSVRTSHRIAGPLFRLGRTLEAVAAGKIPDDVKLRHGDFLKEDAARLNLVLGELRRRRKALSEARCSLRRLRDRKGVAEDSELASELRRVDELLAEGERS